MVISRQRGDGVVRGSIIDAKPPGGIFERPASEIPGGQSPVIEDFHSVTEVEAGVAAVLDFLRGGGREQESVVTVSNGAPGMSIR